MDFFTQIISYIADINVLEGCGLIFGLLCVFFLIKENIWTWPFGIAYVLVSFIIFWDAQLYGDFILHIIFLILNIYGWYHWLSDKNQQTPALRIDTLSSQKSLGMFSLSVVGIYVFAQLLIHLPSHFSDMPPSSLPYWDSTTSVLSVTAMWLTARKFLDNWYYWFVVDVLATGIYYYKGLYFYSALYFIYIGLAIAGYTSWKRSYNIQF